MSSAVRREAAAAPLDAQRDVEPLGHHVDEPRGEVHVDGDGRVAEREAGEDLGEDGDPQVGRGGEPELARRDLVALGKAADRFGQRRELGRDPLVERGAGACERHLARRAGEQRHAERPLELGDLPAHRGARNAELAGGVGEAGRLRDDAEQREKVQID